MAQADTDDGDASSRLTSAGPITSVLDIGLELRLGHDAGGEIGDTETARRHTDRGCRAAARPADRRPADPATPASPSHRQKEQGMADHTYVVSEIVGTSSEDVNQAIRNGVRRASRTLRNLDWFELIEVRGAISDGEIQHYQVKLKVGFRLDDTE
jgi:flavin-binding protein dodecin